MTPPAFSIPGPSRWSSERTGQIGAYLVRECGETRPCLGYSSLGALGEGQERLLSRLSRGMSSAVSGVAKVLASIFL